LGYNASNSIKSINPHANNCKKGLAKKTKPRIGNLYPKNKNPELRYAMEYEG